jgi:hypothetical protein
MTPIFFLYIELTLSSVDSLAFAFRNDPDPAAACRALSLYSRYDQEGPVLDHSAVQLYMELITGFGAISAHRKLQGLRWDFRGHVVSISEDAYAAISSAWGFARELEYTLSPMGGSGSVLALRYTHQMAEPQ